MNTLMLQERFHKTFDEIVGESNLTTSTLALLSYCASILREAAKGAEEALPGVAKKNLGEVQRWIYKHENAIATLGELYAIYRGMEDELQRANDFYKKKS